MAASAQDTKVINASMRQVQALIMDNDFSSTLNIIFRSENPTNTGVWYRFHHGTTFTSWGEKITITLTPVNPNTVNIHILSECGMPTQIVDWGKNKQNINALFTYIFKNIGRYSGVGYSQPGNQSAGFKYCTKCGKQLAADAVFCSGCGAKQ